jgi:dihydropyrimidine dehydrogenase (NAD+) subunit PreT
MAILNNRLTAEQYAENFADIHPPFETKDAALVEANRCLFCYDAPCMKSCPTVLKYRSLSSRLQPIISKVAHIPFLFRISWVQDAARFVRLKNYAKAPVYIISWKKRRYPLQGCSVTVPKWPCRKTGSCLTEKPGIGKKVAVIGAGPCWLKLCPCVITGRCRRNHI